VAPAKRPIKREYFTVNKTTIAVHRLNAQRTFFPQAQKLPAAAVRNDQPQIESVFADDVLVRRSTHAVANRARVSIG
jgi:hypothetical protein